MKIITVEYLLYFRITEKALNQNILNFNVPHADSRGLFNSSPFRPFYLVRQSL